MMRSTPAAAGVAAGDDRKGARSVLGDERGAIVVIGLFFTLFLIGVCWFVFGIGNQIAYRESLQSSADAGAFAAAVYDARGMNLLAMLNVIMGVMLAILVIAHVVQLVVFGIATAACDACIAVPYCGCSCGWDVCPDSCSTMSSTNNVVSDIDTAVHDALEVTHYLEVGIAVGWPWVAAGKSTSAGAYYSPRVLLTTSFSYSQIPYNLDSDVANLTGNIINFGGASSSDTGNTDTRYGLPVASDAYSNLCTVAFMDVTSVGGFIGGSFPGAAAGLLDIAGEWFCDAGADPHWVTTAVEFASSIALTCTVWGFGSPVPTLPMSGNDVDDDQTTYSPMKIYGPAKMGLDYYGVWSTAIGNFKEPVANQLQVAGLAATKFIPGVITVANPPADAVLGVARAEFYYDPRPDELGGGTGSQYDEMNIDTGDSFPIHDVMWNMRWRARLRRYHYFPGILGQADAVATLMNSNFSNVATGAVTAMLNGQSVGDFLSSMVGGTSVDSYTNTPTANIYH
jgi:hypothetical protein